MSAAAFPSDFLWGAATAAYQVEGAAAEDGRGPSVWDAFVRRPGAVREDHTGAIACDQYHHYPEDIRLLQWIGLKAYRFSVAWPRVQPAGRGAINARGLDYYDRLTDALLAAGIQPWCTLFHWDLPQALQDEFGGWRDRRTVECFGDYAAIVARRLGDRIRSFFTINEIGCVAIFGHQTGIHAPGLRLPRREVNRVAHHLLLAHGRAVQALRAHCPRPPRVGLADNPDVCVPILETGEHIAAARRAFRIQNARCLTAIMEGRYLPEFLEAEGADAPVFTEADLRLIGERLDFVGVNIYTPDYIRADPAARHGFASVPRAKTHPRMAQEWLFVEPSIAYWIPRYAGELWQVPAVYISENGCACEDRIAEDGEVWDTDRVFYLRQHFHAAARAVREGAPLKGYFVWSLLDNFEWQKGFTQRLGLVYVNFQTQQRIPKLSAKFMRATISAGAVV